MVSVIEGFHCIGKDSSVTLRLFSSLDRDNLPLFPSSLASQTHLHKSGKGLVNCVYKSCPAAVYNAVQSCCSILSHVIVHHCLSIISTLENSEREIRHLSRYCRNCKNTSRIIFREHTYSATGNSRVHYLKSGYII